jgi:ubiquinone/menaquinone biosynthesis C-methylase UbiE
MMVDNTFDAMFSGVIGQEYQMLKLICPFAAEMSRLVGVEVGTYCQHKSEPQSVLELGGGTGITTLSVLSADERIKVLSVDNEPVMQNQAKQSLQAWIDNGRLAFSTDDALSALRKLEDASVDIVASAYTLHNFEADYRLLVIQEIFRVLKLGGQFINGDRYALDDINAHTRCTQKEVFGYFKVLTEINRLDLLEHWIIHLFSDESENHVMRESVAVKQLNEVGFQAIELKLRQEVNGLVIAKK